MTQPTIQELREKLKIIELRARLIEDIAALDARNMGCPTLEDADEPDMHRLFAQDVLDLIDQRVSECR